MLLCSPGSSPQLPISDSHTWANHLYITHHLGIFLPTCWVWSRQLITRGFHYSQTISSQILLFDHEEHVFSLFLFFFLCQHSRDGERYNTCKGCQECFVGEQVELSHHTHTHSKTSEILLHLHPVSLLPSQQPTRSGSSIQSKSLGSSVVLDPLFRVW